MLSGTNSGSACCFSSCAVVEELVVLDGVVDRCGGEDRVEAAVAGGGVVLGENRVDDGALGERLAGLDRLAVGGL